MKDAYEELYVCTNYIRNDRKLRLLVGRPNYNARDLESATIVISAQMLINEAADEGPPRYYGIGKCSKFGIQALEKPDITHITELHTVVVLFY